MRAIERVKRHEEHVDSEGSWAISYGDMITLLLSFFVLYFTVDHNKIRANKLETALMVQLQGLGIKAPEESLRNQLLIGEKPGDGIDRQVANNLGAKVYQVGHKMLVDFPQVSFFDFGQIDVTKQGAKELDKFVKTYLPFASTHELHIYAYTDTKKVRSDNPRFRDNLELSALRSVAGMRVLQNAGIPLARMKIGGYGELEQAQTELMVLQNERDPLKFNRKIILSIEPQKEGN